MPETTIENLQEKWADELAVYGITAKPWDYLGNMMLSAKATEKVLKLLRKARSLENEKRGRLRNPSVERSVGDAAPSEREI